MNDMTMEIEYRAERCPCGRCNSWHVEPVAAIQGVSFTEEQAKKVAEFLNKLEYDKQVKQAIDRMIEELPR